MGVAGPQKRQFVYIDGKLFVLCGMDSFGEISREVNIFDPETGQWSLGPEFPEEDMDGFGVSAWGKGPNLLATGLDGVVYRLASDRSGWEKLAKLDQGRFFHRMLC